MQKLMNPCFYIVGLLFCLGSIAQAEPILATHTRTPVSSLSRKEARAIFTGKTKKWKGGAKVILVLPKKGSASMKWLCKHVLGVPEDAYRRLVMEKVFKGDMKRPINVRSSSDAKEILLDRRGAISPLSAATLLEDGIKQVTTK